MEGLHAALEYYQLVARTADPQYSDNEADAAWRRAIAISRSMPPAERNGIPYGAFYILDADLENRRRIDDALDGLLDDNGYGYLGPFVAAYGMKPLRRTPYIPGVIVICVLKSGIDYSAEWPKCKRNNVFRSAAPPSPGHRYVKTTWTISRDGSGAEKTAEEFMTREQLRAFDTHGLLPLKFGTNPAAPAQP